MRRRMIVGLMGVLATTSLVLGTSISMAGAQDTPPKAAKCAGKTKKKAIKQIKDAYMHFLDYETASTAADKEPYIQYLSGSKVSPAFQAQFRASSEANAAAAATTSIAIHGVKCDGKKAATVDFDLVLNGQEAPGIAPEGGGEAVIQDRVWKVTGKSLCDMQAAGSPDILESGPCSEIILDGEPSDLTSG